MAMGSIFVRSIESFNRFTAPSVMAAESGSSSSLDPRLAILRNLEAVKGEAFSIQEVPKSAKHHCRRFLPKHVEQKIVPR